MEQHDDVTVTYGGGETEGEAAAGADGAGTGAQKRTRQRGGGLKAILSGFAKPGGSPVSRADAEREAAEEIQLAATPAMERLVLSVPGASSPEDALARIEQTLPARDVPSEPPPADNPLGAEAAHALALYQVRRHLQSRSYRFPTSHEQELARLGGVRASLPAGAGSSSRHN